MITVAVVNLKGGTTKTTSSAFFLHALAESGLNVLGVDADPQGSLVSWSEQADWELPVIGMAVNNLHKQLPGVAGDQRIGERYDAVVIDTPPLEDHRGIVMSTLRAATHVVMPMAPTPIEYERLSAVRSALDDAADLRPDGEAPAFRVLLTRTVPNAASTEGYREAISAEGIAVLRASVGRLERFAQAYGDRVSNALNTAYGDALYEVLEGVAA